MYRSTCCGDILHNRTSPWTRDAGADKWGAMRTHIRVILFSMLIVLTGSVSAYAQLPAEDHVVELGVMFWKPSPELILSTDTLVSAGVNEVDFVQEFGIEDKYSRFPCDVLARKPSSNSFVTFD